MKVLQHCATFVALILTVASTRAWSATPSPELHSRMVNSAHVEKHDLAVNAARGAESQPPPATLLFGKAAFAMLVVLAGFGIILCAPIPRAWVLALCGNYAAATEIYENRLARKPNHLKMYFRKTGNNGFPQSPGFEATTEHSAFTVNQGITIFGCEGGRELEPALSCGSRGEPSESFLHQPDFNRQ